MVSALGKGPVSAVQRVPQPVSAAPTLQRDPPPTATAAAETPEEVANGFQGTAMAYFEDNMRAELMAAAGTEGLSIGQRASAQAGTAIRGVCEPYEADLELDTNVLNTVFALTGGGASVGEAYSSGPRSGQPMTAGAGANVASRLFRAVQGLVNVWIPRMAGYRTVGSLREAAVREATNAAAAGSEGASGTFSDYQSAVMDALHDQWTNDVLDMRNTIINGQVPAGVVQVLSQLLSAKRPEYMRKLRNEYGASGPLGQQTIDAIVGGLSGRLERLRAHLEEAKSHRQHVQEASAIGGGIVGGAAVGAGIGAFFGGVGAVPGAVIGGVVGGVVGSIGALAIAFD